ncbi:MAG: hypothetical protein ACK4MS_09025 [Paracoccaceae bacterium]
MKPVVFLCAAAAGPGLAQMASARTFECEILARCEGRILSTDCTAITSEPVRFEWHDGGIVADIVLGVGPHERVMVNETPREIVFVHPLDEGALFDTMSNAVNRRDLTMMIVPDWERPGYSGEPNWTGRCSEDAHISGIEMGRERENG